jgi:TonB family protein
LLGFLPLPEYNVSNVGGTVVVWIRVDQYGTVTNADVLLTGTTVQNSTLWEAARKAALKAKFNVSSAAPVVQEGTITYEFRLK